MMRFEQLECLLAIVETGSFSEAAKKLYLTQQAVSMNIKQLEQELGQVLMTRENANIVLTQYGEFVVEKAKEIIDSKGQIFYKANEFQETASSQLISISASSCLANAVLPNVIADLRRRKRELHLQILTGETVQAVLDKVKDGECDIGLVTYNAAEFEKIFTEYEDALQLEILARDEILTVMNRKDYDGKLEYVDRNVTPDGFLKANYGIETTAKWTEIARERHIAINNDIAFTQALLDQGSIYVAMSGLSYQTFFRGKKYIGLSMKDLEVPIIHAAVYRKNSEDVTIRVQELVRLIRREMYIK